MGLLIDVMGWIALVFILTVTASLVFALFRIRMVYKKEMGKSDLAMTLSQSEQINQMFEHDASFRRQSDDVSDYEDDYGDDEEDDSQIVKVAIYQGKAYWLADDGFKTAPVDEEEEVQYEYSEDVDTINMKSEELETMLEIIDALKEDQ